MVPSVRLRQVVIMAGDLGRVLAGFEEELGLRDGFRDEGVGQFGLENRVLAVGDCFIEVLAPVSEASSGYRYLQRQGGDSGYMAIFQFRDREAPRQRAIDLGIRIVWQADLADISGTHLDPRDVAGAIVSLDWAEPPASWHWAGPQWRGEATDPLAASSGGITSLEVAVPEPAAVAAKWAAVLGEGAHIDDSDGCTIVLTGASQTIRFVASAGDDGGGREGIVGCGLALEAARGQAAARAVEIGGVRFSVEPLATRLTEEVT